LVACSQLARIFFGAVRFLLAYDFVCSETEQNSSHPTDSRSGWIAGTIVFAVGIPSVLRGVDHRQNTQYVRWPWQAFTRSAMFELKQQRKHVLECLRLQADCMELAKAAHSRDLQSHFDSMARFWSNLAVSGPGSNVGSEIFEAEMQTP
jgi:hypothetical protein